MTIVNFETYVSLEVAKLLKKAGFDWGVYSYYCMDEHARDYKNLCFYTQGFGLGHNDCNSFYGNRTISAPTLAIAQRWLREVKGFEVFVGFTKHDFGNGNEKAYFYDCYEIPENEDAHEYFEDRYYHSYEEAQEAGEKKALELILKKGV